MGKDKGMESAGTPLPLPLWRLGGRRMTLAGATIAPGKGG